MEAARRTSARNRLPISATLPVLAAGASSFSSPLAAASFAEVPDDASGAAASGCAGDFSPKIFFRMGVTTGAAISSSGDGGGENASSFPEGGDWCQLWPHFAQRTLRPDGAKDAPSTG